MPNRIIKESIKYSEEIDGLSWFAEVVFYRLLVTADDYGCLDGRTVLLKNGLFPLKEHITKEDIEAAISELVSARLLYKYTANGKPYLCFPTWDRHQRIRNKHRKFPAPLAVNIRFDGQMTADCEQMPAPCLPESNPNQNQNTNQKKNPKPNPNPKGDDCGGGVTVESYVMDNLRRMSPGNLEELSGFMEIFSGDMIRYAVDVAVGRGAATWAYTRAILGKWMDKDIKTLGDAKAESSARAKSLDQPAVPAHNYQQHSYTDADFGDDFYYNPAKDYGAEGENAN